MNHDKPLNKRGDLTTGKSCTRCKKPFDLLHWTPSKWTLSGWHPHCPACIELGVLHVATEVRAKPGPKPKPKEEGYGRGSYKGRGAHHAAKTHCKQGHEYTPENTRLDKRGCRICRTCTRARKKKHRWTNLPA
jgi:hypothetical protein